MWFGPPRAPTVVKDYVALDREARRRELSDASADDNTPIGNPMGMSPGGSAESRARRPKWRNGRTTRLPQHPGTPRRR